MPTPPTTTSPPELGDVLAVELVIFIKPSTDVVPKKSAAPVTRRTPEVAPVDRLRVAEEIFVDSKFVSIEELIEAFVPTRLEMNALEEEKFVFTTLEIVAFVPRIFEAVIPLTLTNSTAQDPAVKLPLMTVFPPIFILPPTPTPPETTSAPEAVFVLTVLLVMLVTPEILVSFNDVVALVANPPYKTNDPVVALLAALVSRIITDWLKYKLVILAILLYIMARNNLNAISRSKSKTEPFREIQNERTCIGPAFKKML
jgi:hypothetical protein